MIPALLYLLATIDAACCGYRAAAGRSSLIRKRSYYRRAILRGAVFGQVAVAIAGLVILAFITLSPDRAGLIAAFSEAGRRMLFVYLPYAAAVLIAFALRLIPSVDLKSMTSMLIFGPFILVRPLVAVAGIVWAVIGVPRAPIIICGALILFLMLSLEPFLGYLRSERQALPG
jgi:hypothetical protein